MDLKVKKLTTLEELLAFDMITTVAFMWPDDMDELLQKRLDNKDKPHLDDIWGALDEDGNIGAAMLNNIYSAEFDGHTVQAGGIGCVCSLPEFRSKGGIRSVFKEVFRDMYQKGFLFSYLFPFSFPYYRQFGYELVDSPFRYEVPIESLSGYRCDYQVRMLLKNDSLEDMKAVHTEFIKGKNLAIYRRDDQWRVAGGDPFKDRCYKYVFYNSEGMPRAYVIFYPVKNEGDAKWTVAVKDFAYITPADFCQMLGFMYRLRAQYQSLRIALPEEVPLQSMVPECYDVKCHRESYSQMRIINVQKALELMRCPKGEGQVVVAVEDPFMEENTGNYILRYQDGHAVSVQKDSEAEPDIKLSIQRFSQLVIGYMDLDQAAYVSDVEVLHNREILEQLFVRKPIFFMDYF